MLFCFDLNHVKKQMETKRCYFVLNQAWREINGNKKVLFCFESSMERNKWRQKKVLFCDLSMERNKWDKRKYLESEGGQWLGIDNIPDWAQDDLRELLYGSTTLQRDCGVGDLGFYWIYNWKTCWWLRAKGLLFGQMHGDW